ncbi:uncharacterized protein V6R79_018450 [Siganus canaliculatus]
MPSLSAMEGILPTSCSSTPISSPGLKRRASRAIYCSQRVRVWPGSPACSSPARSSSSPARSGSSGRARSSPCPLGCSSSGTLHSSSGHFCSPSGANPESYTSGMKLCKLRDVATSYAWCMQPYLGKPSTEAPLAMQQGERVVLELVAGFVFRRISAVWE